MPVQDLTPQLRTRLSRVERAVGWFVIVATILLLAGFAYYIYSTAERKGWFLTKLRYHTYVNSAAGIQAGDPVMLMGFDAGQITHITAMPPFSDWGNVYVEFVIREPYYGYIWTDSYVKVVSAGFLGKRALEVVQGGTSTNKNLQPSYNIDQKTGKVIGMWDAHKTNFVEYTPNSKGYGFDPARETPVVTDRLEELTAQAIKALPGILDLTNKLSSVLTNVAQATSHADGLLLQVQPVLTNLTLISGLLTNGQGSLGNWAIPTNLNAQLENTLTSASATLTSANTSVTTLATSLNVTLENLGNITSNLNAQVQTNDQIVSRISSVIVDADQFVQGLKHHWLLRSAFKNTTPNPPPARSEESPAPRVPFRAPSAGSKTGKRLP
jgi:ABC-type transporter Mla subunit MlaD